MTTQSPEDGATLTDADLDALAREIYRELYPGPVTAHDSERTPESDRRELDRAYETWDSFDAEWAPARKVRRVLERQRPIIENIIHRSILAALEQVCDLREMHRPVVLNGSSWSYCAECGSEGDLVEWPCPTALVLATGAGSSR